MESRQNKVLLPSAGPKNTPTHQCSGSAHLNSKELSAPCLHLRRHSRKPQRKEAHFIFGKIIIFKVLGN